MGPHNQALYCLIQTVSLFENILSFLSKGGKNFKNLKSNRSCFLSWYFFLSICFWNQAVSRTSSSSRFTIKRNSQFRQTERSILRIKKYKSKFALKNFNKIVFIIRGINMKDIICSINRFHCAFI